MNRKCFESMKPKEVPRDMLKLFLRENGVQAYDLFKLVGFVESKSDFVRQCKNNGLSIENGHLNFIKVNSLDIVTQDSFIDDILLLKKGKTQVKALRL